jgi:hypothetical protein
MRLLRWLHCQSGQGTINLGLIGATFACLIWSMALLSGIDMKPGLSALYQVTEPVRQQLDPLIELLPQ